MRDYLTIVRALVAGQQVDYEGEVLTLTGTRLSIDPPPRTPVYLGALGPKCCSWLARWQMAPV